MRVTSGFSANTFYGERCTLDAAKDAPDNAGDTPGQPDRTSAHAGGIPGSVRRTSGHAGCTSDITGDTSDEALRARRTSSGVRLTGKDVPPTTPAAHPVTPETFPATTDAWKSTNYAGLAQKRLKWHFCRHRRWRSRGATRWKLASYEVAGDTSAICVRPERDDGFPPSFQDGFRLGEQTRHSVSG